MMLLATGFTLSVQVMAQRRLTTFTTMTIALSGHHRQKTARLPMPMMRPETLSRRWAQVLTPAIPMGSKGAL